MAARSKAAGPLTGAHTSAAGGAFRALERGDELGCRTVQIFTKNANQWAAKPLAESDIEAFHDARKATGLGPVVAHDSYLINLASFDRSLYRKSLNAFEDELRRAETLGVDFLVTHPGAHLGKGEDVGVARVAESLSLLHEKTDGFNVKICLETTAGQGTTLGYTFEHLRDIIDQTKASERLGVCFDTCHVFAAGYDIRTAATFRKTLRAFDTVVGLDRLLVIHANDSKKEFGSRVDRHDHIGQGHIGEEAFRTLMRSKRLAEIPKILETPESETMHAVNLRHLNDLAG